MSDVVEFLRIHPDLGKGGAGLSEPLGGITLRELLLNHQAVTVDLRETVQQITIDGANVQATGDYFEATPGQTLFALAAEPLGQVEVRVNGSTQIPGRDFEIVGTLGARSVEWHSPDFAMADGDIVTVNYIRVTL